MATILLVFDLSGVFFNDGLTLAVKRISKKYKLDPEVVRFVLNGDFSEHYRQGLVKDEAFWNRVSSYLKIKNIGEMRDIFFNAYRPHKDSVVFIKQLRRKKIRIAFLSNSPRDRVAYLDKKYHFRSLFDFGLFSYEAHVWKPNRNMYEKFLSKFKLQPHQVIYIDDQEKNLLPARKLRMKTILFQNIPQLRRSLQKLGLLV